MLTQEHAQTAQDFLAVADDEFASGDMLQGSEKMWGAAAHAVMAVAQQRGWTCESYVEILTSARRLAGKHNDEVLISGLIGAAAKFRANFYHDFMEHDADFERSKDVISQFVNRMLSLMDESPNGSPE